MHHIKLEKVTLIAMFHLERFENNITKIKDHVKFLLLLDLAPFVVRADVSFILVYLLTCSFIKSNWSYFVGFACFPFNVIIMLK